MQTSQRLGRWFGTISGEDDPDHADAETEWGDWLYERLVEEVDIETEPWAVELVQRVAARLNQARWPAAPLEPVILWMTSPMAFTAPGRYIYYSRGLLHMASGEEPVAFVLAHEMAHHDLGHTRFFRGKLAPLRHLPGALVLAAVQALADHWLNSAENEAVADACALDLCRAAGYEGALCVRIFDVLEAYALDYHAIECVFGPEEALQPHPEGLSRWPELARSWVWQHCHSHPPIRNRKEALLARLSDGRAAIT
jgi:Zn-dependent protease with chaperone function